MARKSGQIPMDDEPMDIDIGDLPTDEEFAAAEAATASGAPVTGQGMGSGARAQDSLFGLLQAWFTLVMVVYLLAGIAVGGGFIYFGAGRAGLTALTHPTFYLIIVFWPIAIWQLLFNQP